MTALAPSLPEQRAIAAFLDRETGRIDELIAKQQRLIELLAEKRTALISHAVTKGLNPDAPMKTTGFSFMSNIPAHWDVKRLKHISPKQTVGVVVNPSSYFADDGVPFLLGNNVSEGLISVEGVRFLSDESNALLCKSRLRAGDIVVVRVGEPGVAAVISNELDGCNCASMMLVRQRPTFDSQWMCYAFNSRMIRSQVNVVKYGAAQKQFNISHAVDFWFAVPPPNEQCAIAKHLDWETARIDELVGKVRDAIGTLREYRSALISATITGKIDVREVKT